ncbi:MAG: insulinase family protein, partial [Deltaproteobacteria bacterium]|nr:insulinase family protein [Deltaproteobacteria bacterium]
MSIFVESSDVLPLVDLEIALPVGSLQDPAGQEGLAQLTGHLMRRGPRGLSQERFEDRLASLGARMSVEVSMRSTRVRATVLRRNLEPLLALLADVVWQP